MMENNDKAKTNILKGVSQKLKKRTLIIVAVVVVVCGAIAAAVIYATPPKEVKVEVPTEKTYEKIPFSEQIIINADEFQEIEKELGEVKVYTKMETINQLDDRELLYNHIYLPMPKCVYAPMEINEHFHAVNNDDNTATLYFYNSKNCVDTGGLFDDMSGYVDTLFGRHLCSTCGDDMVVNEITKVYYLVYDYDNFDQATFDAAVQSAVLLWEK